MNVPGSDSSELQTRYLGFSLSRGVNDGGPACEAIARGLARLGGGATQETPEDVFRRLGGGA